jgi:mRNA-degrading endonuclease RelE of RelBE toxin-antitoxin system
MTGPYKVEFASPAVERQFAEYLRRLSEKSRRQVAERMDMLEEFPRPAGKSFKVLKPPVKILQFVAHCRLRIGDHRVLYDLDDERRVVVVMGIRRRSEKTYRG